LRQIRDFIAKDNQDAARRVILAIRDATIRLRQFPQSGRPIGRFKSRGLREVLVGKYLIPYAVEGDQVRILRVLYGARLIESEDPGRE